MANNENGHIPEVLPNTDVSQLNFSSSFGAQHRHRRPPPASGSQTAVAGAAGGGGGGTLRFDGVNGKGTFLVGKQFKILI